MSHDSDSLGGKLASQRSSFYGEMADLIAIIQPWVICQHVVRWCCGRVLCEFSAV